MVYQNEWLSMREDRIQFANGSHGLYSVVDKPDFVVVIPMENDGFHLVEQYRYPVQCRSWEFPSGSLTDQRTCSPEATGAAELAEETGFTAGRLDKLGYLHCANSLIGEGFHVFLATDLVAGEPSRESIEQDMRQQWFPRAQVEHMLRRGTITDSATAAAYLLLPLRE